MATHQLYVGAGSNPKLSRAAFPAQTFVNTDPAFTGSKPAAHKGPAQLALTRTLDFRDDYALKQYVRDNVITEGDVLNICLIPPRLLLYGVEVNVERAGPDLDTITFALSDGTAIGTAAVVSDTVGARFSPPAGAAWVTGGAASLATARYNVAPVMLTATLTVLTADNTFGDLRISVTPLVSVFEGGAY
ncbi:hypothetical protein KC887_06175 [Candidatus Kaiserbacteria bacterium]|nr:hypothetical protein [Candidatus Kaiserbacteria bacterium]